MPIKLRNFCTSLLYIPSDRLLFYSPDRQPFVDASPNTKAKMGFRLLKHKKENPWKEENLPRQTSVTRALPLYALGSFSRAVFLNLGNLKTSGFQIPEFPSKPEVLQPAPDGNTLLPHQKSERNSQMEVSRWGKKAGGAAFNSLNSPTLILDTSSP